MFDEEPDGDPHGECAAEIQRLGAAHAAAERDAARWRKLKELVGVWESVESSGIVRLCREAAGDCFICVGDTAYHAESFDAVLDRLPA